MSFGTYDPTRGNAQSTRPKRFYLNYGSNVYRVLPPVKSLASKNKIAQFWSVIWLTDSKNKKRPVASVLKKMNNVVTQNDPVLDRLAQMQAELNAALASGQPQQVVQMLKESMKSIMHKKIYALNVLNAAGELGVLEIPYTSYQNLDQRIKELHTRGVDAIGIGADKGALFDFKKTKDERGKTTYPVDAAMSSGKDAAGNFVLSYLRMPLTAEEAASISERAEDLGNLFTELSYEEMQALATLDQRAFDAVFQKPQVVEESNEDEETQAESMGIYNPLAQSTSTTAINPLQSAGSNIAMNMHSSGQQLQSNAVVSNQQVKNFLFPDKKG